MSENIIDASSLCKTYADGNAELTILNNVNLSIKAKKTTAIVGASGSGKSTLLHILGTLDKPDSGKILSGNQDLTTLSKRAQAQFRNQSLGFVYQFHHLLPEFSALENIAMPLFIAGVSRTEALERAEQLIRRVGLLERASHFPQQLSGGERQRIAISRALVNRPLLVLADEPTGNLDAKTSGQMYELIAQINEEFETAFVIVTHDNQLASKMHEAYQLTNGSLNRITG